MDYLQVSIDSVIAELLAENRKMVLEVATLRAGVSDISAKCGNINNEIYGNADTSPTEESK